MYPISALCAAAGLCLAQSPIHAAEPEPARVRVAFGSDCETMLIREIDRSQKDIQTAIYSITRRNITRAFVRAAKRGVKVRIKYDAGSYKWKGMQQAIGYMKKRGVTCASITRTNKFAKMHHKFSIIDKKRVLTGSYNYTTSGTASNDENLLLVESPIIAQSFSEEFERIKNH